VRNSTIDLLKALASQIIVVHHLLLYTPMSPVLQAEWPGLLGFIADEGRYVVQIFLVIERNRYWVYLRRVDRWRFGRCLKNAFCDWPNHSGLPLAWQFCWVGWVVELPYTMKYQTFQTLHNCWPMRFCCTTLWK